VPHDIETVLVLVASSLWFSCRDFFGAEFVLQVGGD